MSQSADTKVQGEIMKYKDMDFYARNGVKKQGDDFKN